MARKPTTSTYDFGPISERISVTVTTDRVVIRKPSTMHQRDEEDRVISMSKEIFLELRGIDV